MMPFWREQTLKALVLLATLAAIFGSIVFAAIGIVANGSAISDIDFSWSMAAATGAIVLSQVVLCMAGCRAGWRLIERWSDRLRDQR